MTSKRPSSCPDVLQHIPDRRVFSMIRLRQNRSALLTARQSPRQTVNLYFNLASGPGAHERGPWDREPTFQDIADPLQHEMQEHGGRSSQSN